MTALETFERVEIAEIIHHFTPVALTKLGHARYLAARDQDQRIGCITSHKIAPVALKSVGSPLRSGKFPRSNNTLQFI